MRLIDADALMEDVSKRYCEECEKRRGIKKGRQTIVYEIGDAPCRACSVDDMKYELETAPTIEERKKGKWIEDAETYYRAVNEKGGGVDENTPYFVDDIACPECLTMFSTIENCTELFDYCPHCGADMRGEAGGEA